MRPRGGSTRVPRRSPTSRATRMSTRSSSARSRTPIPTPPTCRTGAREARSTSRAAGWSGTRTRASLRSCACLPATATGSARSSARGRPTTPTSRRWDGSTPTPPRHRRDTGLVRAPATPASRTARRRSRESSRRTTAARRYPTREPRLMRWSATLAALCIALGASCAPASEARQPAANTKGHETMANTASKAEIEDAASRYLTANRGRKADEFRIEVKEPAPDYRYLVAWGVFLKDETDPVPGSGQSLILHLDPHDLHVVRVLRFQ